MYGYYVYGIMRGNDGVCVPRLPEKGISSTYPVYALPDRAIQAIVSKVPLSEFGEDVLETNLRDFHWLAAKVHSHERIVEAIQAECTLIPMRFCTIFWSEDRVLEMMAAHYDDFVDALTRLAGKKEWGVKVYCDSAILGTRIGEISVMVRRLKTELAEKSAGAGYMWEKRLAKAIDAEIEAISDEYAQHSHNRLSDRAEESVTCALQGRETTGRTDEMILNGAYLVAYERLGDFQSELATLEKEYGAFGFDFEMTGPWPPYNFVAIHQEKTGEIQRSLSDESAGKALVQ